MTTRRSTSSRPKSEQLRERAARLKLNGLVAHWDEYVDAPWLEQLLAHEEGERHQRSLDRRLRDARLGSFRLMADFDWSWPRRIDRQQVEELFRFEFLSEAGNVIVVGPNGVGKTTIAQNLAYQAVLQGHSARLVTASELLNELAAQESSAALTRRLRSYTRMGLLVIDEVGYLSYDSRHADLLFEVISRRNQVKSTVLTTNRPFNEWNEVFPNAACVVALIDRLVHRAEIVQVDGDSYRLKEAKEREERRASDRAARKKSSKGPTKALKTKRSRGA